ncbi:hypothetical protein [Streptomyces sp. URMC 129]|uniref:hypothetical protein n=1 Tax=Streptomyces sp. URMC 129 TaxID=3423407 RepID=UPI003F1A2657
MRGGMMLLELVAEALDALSTSRPEFESRWKRRRRARAFAAGKEVRFPGAVVGPEPYGGRPANVLLASRRGLASAYRPARRRTRREVPVERLRLVTVRPRSKGDRKIPRYCHVAVCRDGDAEVLIVCAPWNMPYVTHLLRRAGGVGGAAY